MLEARSLTKYYAGTAAVRDVSFAIRPGEILGYLGPNGAGKSTTVKMLVGLIEPSEGQIFYRGRSVYDDRVAFERRIGYVPEEPHLYPHLCRAPRWKELDPDALWYSVAESFPPKNGHQDGHQTQGRPGRFSGGILLSVLVSIFRPNGVASVDFRDFRDL
jgi:hypothetical protein